MSKRIIIEHKGEEGAMHVDAQTGTITTPANERPEWGAGLAVAMLASRVGWYEQRLGANMPDSLRSPGIIDFHDLDFVGVDEAGDEVEVEASIEYRTEKLASLLELDLDADNFEDMTDSAMVDHTYKTAPTSEKTLAEAEGKSFEEKQKSTGS